MGSFFEAGFVGNKRLELNSLSSTCSEVGTSTSFKLYGGDSERGVGDHRLVTGLEIALLILEQKLIASCLVYTQRGREKQGKEKNNKEGVE